MLLWEPQHGHPNRGRPRTTYIDTIKADTGLDNTKEIRDAMLNQVVLKDFIRTAWDNLGISGKKEQSKDRFCNK